MYLLVEKAESGDWVKRHLKEDSFLILEPEGRKEVKGLEVTSPPFQRTLSDSLFLSSSPTSLLVNNRQQEAIEAENSDHRLLCLQGLFQEGVLLPHFPGQTPGSPEAGQTSSCPHHQNHPPTGGTI